MYAYCTISVWMCGHCICVLIEAVGVVKVCMTKEMPDRHTTSSGQCAVPCLTCPLEGGWLLSLFVEMDFH